MKSGTGSGRETLKRILFSSHSVHCASGVYFRYDGLIIYLFISSFSNIILAFCQLKTRSFNSGFLQVFAYLQS